MSEVELKKLEELLLAMLKDQHMQVHEIIAAFEPFVDKGETT